MKIFKNILITLTILGLSGCKFLDFNESVGDSKDFFYSYFDNVKRLLTYPYSLLYEDFGSVDGAMLDCATDDAEYAYSKSLVQGFNDGSWSAMKTLDSTWNVSYTAIRSLNDFISTFAETDFSRFKNNIDYAQSMAEIQSYPYEARLLRVIFLFDLAKRYGDIPMPLKTLTITEANEITKTPFDDVIVYIVNECDSTAEHLPVNYVNEISGETGRVTKGIAMALKSRALLYAASKLHNPGNDVNKWQKAAMASLDLINSNIYILEPNINTVITNSVTSREVIMERRNTDNNAFEKLNFPIGYQGGQSGTCPSQNLVDAFQTKNGYDVVLTATGWNSADPGFNPNSPYANRDPRLYKSILYDGATWKGRPVESFIGGLDGYPIQGATPTGYYLRKYLVETVDLSPSINSMAKHHWIVFRYAETLLNYAEAMNEAFGPTYSDATYTLTALAALNQVGTRATMPALSGLTKDAFTTALRRERRVEFAFEGLRFWDVRRWMIGESTQKTINGVSISKNAGGLKTYTLNNIDSRVWDDKMYFYPIPQQELNINKNLSQNKGW